MFSRCVYFLFFLHILNDAHFEVMSWSEATVGNNVQSLPCQWIGPPAAQLTRGAARAENVGFTTAAVISYSISYLMKKTTVGGVTD